MLIDDSLKQKASKIKLLILDVDGVLTDGKLYIDHKGNETKSFHTQDGLGMRRLQNLTDIIIAVISGRHSLAVEHRLTELGVDHYYLGHENKITIFNQLIAQLNISKEEVAYVGDDLPDLDIMRIVQLSFAVENAVDEVKQKANLITKKSGGCGAVREVCDILIGAKK